MAGLGFLLSDAARLLRRRFQQKARGVGLTSAQWQTLAYLVRNEGINQAGMANLLDIEPITLCRLIDRMEEGGWVERRPNPADRRARLLFMTDKSRPLLAEMRAIAQEVYEEAVAGLAPEVRSHLMEGLRSIVGNLSDRPAAETEHGLAEGAVA